MLLGYYYPSIINNINRQEDILTSSYSQMQYIFSRNLLYFNLFPKDGAMKFFKLNVKNKPSIQTKDSLYIN
jgi:hypothetical protein